MQLATQNSTQGYSLDQGPPAAGHSQRRLAIVAAATRTSPRLSGAHSGRAILAGHT